MLMHFHAYVPILYLSFDTKMFGAFLCVCLFVCVCVCVCLSLSLSLLLVLVCSMHLNTILLHPRTFFVLGHLPLILLPLMSGSVMRRQSRTSQRTLHDMAFIQNAKSFYRIFSVLTFLLSSTIEVRSHCVAS